MKKKAPTVYKGLIHIKDLGDGATTMPQLIALYQAAYNQLQRFADAGVKLSAPVDDRYAHFETTDRAVAKKLGFWADDPDEVDNEDGSSGGK